MVTHPASSDTEFCLWRVKEMKNGTMDGSSCHKLGRFHSISFDGTMVAYSPLSGIICLVETADLFNPGPGACATGTCTIPGGGRGGGNGPLAVTGDYFEMSADGQIVSQTVPPSAAINTAKVSDMVGWATDGWNEAEFLAFSWAAAGVTSSKTFHPKAMARDGRVAFTASQIDGSPMIYIYNTRIQEHVNITIKYRFPIFWGFSATDADQALFYMESVPGTPARVCATKTGTSSECIAVGSPYGGMGPVLMGGYTGGDGVPVAIFKMQSAAAESNPTFSICTQAVKSGGEITCLTGLDRYGGSEQGGQFNQATEAVPRIETISIPASGSGAWLYTKNVKALEQRIVDLTKLVDGALGKQTYKNLPTMSLHRNEVPFFQLAERSLTWINKYEPGQDGPRICATIIA